MDRDPPGIHRVWIRALRTIGTVHRLGKRMWRHVDERPGVRMVRSARRGCPDGPWRPRDLAVALLRESPNDDWVSRERHGYGLAVTDIAGARLSAITSQWSPPSRVENTCPCSVATYTPTGSCPSEPTPSLRIVRPGGPGRHLG